MKLIYHLPNLWICWKSIFSGFNSDNKIVCGKYGVIQIQEKWNVWPSVNKLSPKLSIQYMAYNMQYVHAI